MDNSRKKQASHHQKVWNYINLSSIPNPFELKYMQDFDLVNFLLRK